MERKRYRDGDTERWRQRWKRVEMEASSGRHCNRARAQKHGDDQRNIQRERGEERD